jgi:HPt (histidine-containing phosphotransfer) domain-containing protein
VTDVDSQLEVLNRKHLAEMSFGDEDFEREIINDFLAAIPGLIGDMTQGTASGSCKLVAHASHTLKGSCRSLGVERVAATCQDLECQAREGDLHQAPDLIERIKSEIEDFRLAARSGWGL